MFGPKLLSPFLCIAAQPRARPSSPTVPSILAVRSWRNAWISTARAPPLPGFAGRWDRYRVIVSEPASSSRERPRPPLPLRKLVRQTRKRPRFFARTTPSRSPILPGLIQTNLNFKFRPYLLFLREHFSGGFDLRRRHATSSSPCAYKRDPLLRPCLLITNPKPIPPESFRIAANLSFRVSSPPSPPRHRRVHHRVRRRLLYLLDPSPTPIPRRNARPTKPESLRRFNLAAGHHPHPPPPGAAPKGSRQRQLPSRTTRHR